MKMKFYELQQLVSGGRWRTLGFFRKRKDAEIAEAQYNTKIMVGPTKIVNRKFTTKKEIEN